MLFKGKPPRLHLFAWAGVHPFGGLTSDLASRSGKHSNCARLGRQPADVPADNSLFCAGDSIPLALHMDIEWTVLERSIEPIRLYVDSLGVVKTRGDSDDRWPGLGGG